MNSSFPKSISAVRNFLKMLETIESASQDEDSRSQPKKLFQCPECEYTCYTSGVLRSHKSRKHRKQINIPEEADPCICYRCNIKFKKVESLISHKIKFHRQRRQRYAVEADKTSIKDITDSLNQQTSTDSWIKDGKIEDEQKILNYLDSFLCVSKAMLNNLDAFIAIFKKQS